MSQREEQQGRNRSGILAVGQSAILRRGLTRLANEESNLVVDAEAQSAYQAAGAVAEQQIGLEFASHPQFIHVFQIAHLRGTEAFHIQRCRSVTKKKEKKHFFAETILPYVSSEP
jgi:hypothetical protein